MKVEIDLPEIPGYEYTGEYRPYTTGEFYYDHGGAQKANWDSGGYYPILRKKEKPKIIIYQWLVSGDVGYTTLNATEEFMVDVCKRAGWSYVKMSEVPIWSLDGDTL